MLDLLLQTYAYKKDPKYISNNDILDFFKQYRDVINYEDFISIRNYFTLKLSVSRYAFTIIEKEYFTQPSENFHPVSHTIIPVQDGLPGHYHEFEDCLKLKKYSPRTIKIYLGTLKLVNQWSCERKEKNADDLNEIDIFDFFKYLVNVKKASGPTIRLYRFSLNFYFSIILKKKIDFSFMSGLRSSKHLPVILTREEIQRLLDSINNLKHRTMIALMYSSGLRLSELLSLRVRDIDLVNLVIHVKQGKGKKDRITIFSAKIAAEVKRFMVGKSSAEYLFVASGKDRQGRQHPLSGRTVQKVLETALKRAGIAKAATPHDLRHSFATHLLENGISLRHIQELLGHKNISTTTIYTKVCNPHLRGIRSPL